MLDGMIFVVYVKELEKIGLYAIPEKISRNNNLIGYIKGCTNFNVCKTWKEAQELAVCWNNCFIENGKQKTA